MRKDTFGRIILMLLGLCFIWYLSLSYVFLSNSEQLAASTTGHNRLRQHDKVETKSPKAMRRGIIKVVDDLLDLVESSDNNSPPPPSRDYKEEFQSLQIKMEEEKEKGQLRNEMTEDLRSDKLQLQQEVAHLKKLLQLQEEAVSPPPPLGDYKEELHSLQIKMEAEKEKEKLKDEMIKNLRSDKLQLQHQVSFVEKLLKPKEEKEEKKVKTDEQIKGDENCPLPPLDGYPHCKDTIKVMEDIWRTDPCYSSYGVNGSLCSILIYLSEVETWCPGLPGRVIPVVVENPEILVHPGALTKESGFKITDSAFNGGPLGELVQWSDLISTLYILGHHLNLTVTIPDLKLFLGAQIGGCPTPHLHVEANLIYTDIIGFKQIKTVLQASWIKYRCKFRILDTFGTEPDFNHVAWAKKHNFMSPFGSLNMIPTQFYTMFPHTPDNTFLGFVVQHQLSAEETERLKSTKRQNRALVYGKRATFWEGKGEYLEVLHKHLEIHGTADRTDRIPSYVINHGIVRGTEVQVLLRQSKVFVGLSFPYEGPAPLEAIANGCAFLNPRLHPPQSSLNSKFFKGKPNIREVTSQHPYAEAIGEPYVWMVDMHNSTDVERALTAILNKTIEPYLPYEFSCEGMLQRVNILIEKQDLCKSTGSWPPLSALQVVKAGADTSCKQACQKAGLICEPAFFPNLNSANNLATHNVDCQTSELSDSNLVFPAYNSSSKHCVFQSDPLLFSCVRSDQSLIRICPCRDYIKQQIALCKACI
ncbi:alpha-1,6-mannosylglycoprotein 6-beta-N-acetylglucosaminyltransferase A-like [Anoplopoma fimbria]|uniref:alpha-1,6-mannosylglycoprotein 6-beta-N-acetylglucosaminyltransferase A-like n=1 Tax=Anoplopoma fimbria TaxID=229290 RepID=UPI0023EBAFD3|nr:alpha-1,6-mannosylglycoprotein 6-beta-N-acetylglucosaminyltransferase A-like [Anoplopoma fimbria]